MFFTQSLGIFVARSRKIILYYSTTNRTILIYRVSYEESATLELMYHFMYLQFES